MNNYYFSFQEQYFLIPMHEDKVVESKTEKSKHLQRKNFGTAGKQIEKNFSTCIVALNKVLGIFSCGLHCQ